MEKFYNNPAWRRIRGLRSFGILALSVAFCLTGLLALSSCDLEFWEDDDETQVEPEVMEMSGFFTSADDNGDTVCSNEDVMYIWKETNLQANLMSQSSVRVVSSEKRNLNTWGRSLSMTMAIKPS